MDMCEDVIFTGLKSLIVVVVAVAAAAAAAATAAAAEVEGSTCVFESPGMGGPVGADRRLGGGEEGEEEEEEGDGVW